MGIFNFILKKNGSTLNQDEKESAQILRNLINGILPNDREKYSIGLSIGLYTLAFKRSNKKFVPYEELLDTINIMTKPKLIHYVGIFKSIAEIVSSLIKKFDSVGYKMSLNECENTVLYILQQAADKINEV